MQDYLANTLSSSNLILPVGLVAVVAVAGGSYAVYSRRGQNPITNESSVELAKEKSLGTGERLSIMDTCPFCNIALRNISGNRFQCRKCRRYYKK